MSKLGWLGWIGIVLMVGGFGLIPQYATTIMSRGYAEMNQAGGNASPGLMAGYLQRSLEISRFGPSLGMFGVALVILAFAKRLPDPT